MTEADTLVFLAKEFSEQEKTLKELSGPYMELLKDFSLDGDLAPFMERYEPLEAPLHAYLERCSQASHDFTEGEQALVENGLSDDVKDAYPEEVEAVRSALLALKDVENALRKSLFLLRNTLKKAGESPELSALRKSQTQLTFYLSEMATGRFTLEESLLW